jgi:hypothetical protein
VPAAGKELVADRLFFGVIALKGAQQLVRRRAYREIAAFWGDQGIAINLKANR